MQSPAKAPNLTDYRVTFFQFEVVEREYKSKRTGAVKLTKRTERVQKEASIIDLVEDFTSIRKENFFTAIRLKMISSNGAELLTQFQSMGGVTI